LFGRLRDKMIKNKKGLILKNAFFAIIVVSVFILAVGQIVGTWSEQYGSGLTYDLNEYSDLDSIRDTAGTFSEGTTSEDADPGTGDYEGKMLRGGYGIVGSLLSLSPIKGVFNMIESVETRFSLPQYLSEAIVTMMILAFVFTIVAVIFRLARSTA